MSGLLSNACVVLVRTQGPVNLGMVARLCGNLGVTDLRLVAPQCEVNCPETRMFSTHSKDFILNAPVFPDLPSALHGCSLAIGTSARNRDPDYGECLGLPQVPDFLQRRHAGRFALVFGNEADGLTDGELIHCQGWLHLDTFGPNTSYNLSHAVAITLYHLAALADQRAIANAPSGSNGVAIKPTTRHNLDLRDERPASATRESVALLFDYWLETLARFQYFRRTDRERFAPNLQRLFNRIDLSEHDVQMLRGMLAQFHLFSFGDRGLPTTPANTRENASENG
jgi:tRNA/rRNA methyltransferase